MTDTIRTTPKKLSGIPKEMKMNNRFYPKEKSLLKQIIQHLVHPDYILFDWEFYSNALEFE
ncbi:MAG TPA: hypothetical protein VFW07_12530 [Parafilimonas sp.]|nr:hypothetical protein [Parafilimonas sp.]